MGVDYELMFLDEFDWGYLNMNGPEEIIQKVKEIMPSAELICKSYGMLIFNCGTGVHRMHPDNFIDKIKYDRLLYRDDLNLLAWQDAENFRSPL